MGDLATLKIPLLAFPESGAEESGMDLQYGVGSRDKMLGKVERHSGKDYRNDVRRNGKMLLRSNDWHASFVAG